MPATFIKGTGAPRLIRAGDITVDKYGLATGTAVWWAYAKADLYGSGVTGIGYPHPNAPSLKCEKMVYADSDNGATLTASYAGLLTGVAPDPVDELDTAVMEAPIDAHPDFATFAGTPTAPLNGAVFIKDSSGNYRFDCFGPSAPAGLRGVTSFEAPTSIVRRTSITLTRPTPGQVGTLRVPYETFGLNASWLLVGCSSQKRGNVYVTKYEWKAGGRLGWNTQIYS